MDLRKESNEFERPRNWNDLLGPFMRHEELPESTKNDDGLIVLETNSGQKVCPAGQFNPAIVCEDGSVNHAIDPWVGALWKVAKEFEIGQLGFGTWSTAATILSPLQGSQTSFVERLFACTDDSLKEGIIMEYVARAESGAAWSGIDLALPGQQIEPR